MLPKKFLVGFLIIGFTFGSVQHSLGEPTEKLIQAIDYSFKPTPAGMLFARETLMGFEGGSVQYLGRTTTKGPDDSWIAAFEPCSEKITDYCIESVSYRKSESQKWINGSVSDWKPTVNDPGLLDVGYTADGEIRHKEFFIHPETGLPRGGYAKVWNLPGAIHGGGEGYLVGASVSFQRNQFQTFGVGITPIKFGNTPTGRVDFWPFTYGDRFNFPRDIELQMKIRMGKFKETIGTWFNGRILDPILNIDGSTMTLSGTPTRVLAAHTGPVSCENRVLSTEVMERCLKRDQTLDTGSTSTLQLNPSIENATNLTSSYPKGLFEYLEPLLKPIGYISHWSGTTSGAAGTSICPISPGKLAIVSSNAALYSTSPPVWSESDQTLAYRVGSIHLDHTGATHRGHFNLAVPKDFAQCLWGQNILNARATVAVTNADGTNNVATSVLSQDAQMVYFKVAGFTFSTPQIKIKLEVPQIQPTPTQTPITTVKPVPIQKTITCVKGKVTKKIKAVAPKCPAGYKKK